MIEISSTYSYVSYSAITRPSTIIMLLLHRAIRCVRRWYVLKATFAKKQDWNLIVNKNPGNVRKLLVKCWYCAYDWEKMPPALPQSATGLAPLFGHSPENEKGETAVRIPVYTTRSLLPSWHYHSNTNNNHNNHTADTMTNILGDEAPPLQTQEGLLPEKTEEEAEAEVVQEENATKAELEEVRAEIERLNNIVRLLKTSSEDSALQAEILKDENKALQAQNESLLEEQRKIKESLPAVEPAPIPNDKSSSSTPVKEARPWYDLIIKFPKSPVGALSPISTVVSDTTSSKGDFEERNATIQADPILLENIDDGIVLETIDDSGMVEYQLEEVEIPKEPEEPSAADLALQENFPSLSPEKLLEEIHKYEEGARGSYSLEGAIGASRSLSSPAAKSDVLVDQYGRPMKTFGEQITRNAESQEAILERALQKRKIKIGLFGQ